MNELEKLMFDTKPAWQERRGGLQGEMSEQIVEQAPPVAHFSISESRADTSRVRSGKKLELRPNPDGTYMPN